MVNKQLYGTTKNGQQVNEYILKNGKGLEIHCIDYGCRLTKILVPGEGGPVDILLGFDTLAEYEADTSFQGAFVGRYSGRIIGAAFTIDGEEYALTKNDGENYLHGSFSNTVFEGAILEENSVIFRLLSPHGEDGFPGDVEMELVYTLTDENELVMDIRATTSEPTHLNFTNHSYFNMAGQGAPNLDGQVFWINASRFLEGAEGLVPTGRMMECQGGAFDFTEEKAIGEDLLSNDPQIQLAGGYDHSFVLEKLRPEALTPAAAVRHLSSGRAMQVYTTQPSVHFYTGNFLGNGPAGKGNTPMNKHGAFCLETQHFPASPNFSHFPTTRLNPGERFHEINVLLFEW